MKNEYQIVYTAPPISEVAKTRTVFARCRAQAVVILESEIGRKVDSIISIEIT